MGIVSTVGEATRVASATDSLPIGSDSARGPGAARAAARGRGVDGGRALQHRLRPALADGRQRHRGPADRGAREPAVRRCSAATTALPCIAVVPVEASDATAIAEAVKEIRAHGQGGPARRGHGAGHRSGCGAGRPRGSLRGSEHAPAHRHGLRRRAAARAHLPQPHPVDLPAHRRRRGRPAGRRARDPHARRLRRRVGRVDDRHPLGARLRCRHRLRAAAHLALPRRAAQPPRPSGGDVARAAPHRRGRPLELGHGRPRSADPAALALPGHPGSRARLCRRHRRRCLLRAPRAARRARHLRPLDLLAPGAARGRVRPG